MARRVVFTIGSGAIVLRLLTLPSACAAFAGDGDAVSPDNADAAVRIEDSSVESAVDADWRCPATADKNVLLCADFEEGIGCTGWSGRGTTPEPTTAEAHGGKRSCRLCVSGSGLGDMFHALQITSDLPANTSLDMVAYVKNENITIPDASVGGVLQTTSAGAQYQSQGVGRASLGSSWTRLAISYTPTYVSVRGNVFLSLPAGLAEGACFFVDDLIVTSTPP
jgi:hypothetical protein